MKTETTICDFWRGATTATNGESVQCRSLADGVCLLCNKDGCKEHVSANLYTGVGLGRSKSTPDFSLLFHQGQLCLKCAELFIAQMDKIHKEQEFADPMRELFLRIFNRVREGAAAAALSR